MRGQTAGVLQGNVAAASAGGTSPIHPVSLFKMTPMIQATLTDLVVIFLRTNICHNLK